jgi:glucosyl-dolichyl phosphate glucuronosyltransferase
LKNDSSSTKTAERRDVVVPITTAVAEGSVRARAARNPLTVSVVICAYTEDRWPLLLRSVASAQDQRRAPIEVIVCVDHNVALFERCRQWWADQRDSPSASVVVIANKYGGRLGSARNSAAEVARGDIVAFLDDDAWADPDWLDNLLSPYAEESVVAVGGAPVPEFEAGRPHWFPLEFDWVFGCAYAGLPETQAPVGRLIGANMSVRRLALSEIGGFHSDDHDDMDMCHRLRHLRPADHVVYEPAARVHHFVPAVRTTWGYFWRRCFFVNRGKVEAFRQMEGAANRSADVGFVAHALSRGVSKGLQDALRGDPWGAARAGSIVAGVALAGSGHVAGVWQGRRAGSRRPTRGVQRTLPRAGAAPTDGPVHELPVDGPPLAEHQHFDAGRQA